MDNGNIYAITSDKEINENNRSYGNIYNCTNNATVSGERHVGGIVGLAKTGDIKSCINNGTIEGQNIGEVAFTPSIDDWWKGVENFSGTGGIVGTLSLATVRESCNRREIKCNYNGGGIAGFCFDSEIKYCYNSGDITKTDYDSNKDKNRLGGIAGGITSSYVEYCYNLGNIEGTNSLGAAPNKSAVGGIVASANNGKRKKNNAIIGCYNTGKVIGHFTPAGQKPGSEDTWYNGGIIGYTEEGTNFSNNIYIKKNVDSGRGVNGYADKANEYQGYDEEEVKEQLYIWANNELFSNEDSEDKLIYNTIKPLETNKGYDGYGVLWWEIENYHKLTVHITNENYDKIVSNANIVLDIGSSSIGIGDNECYIKQNDKGYNCHTYILMVPDYQYELNAEAKLYDKLDNNVSVTMDSEKVVYIRLQGKIFELDVYANTPNLSRSGSWWSSGKKWTVSQNESQVSIKCSSDNKALEYPVYVQFDFDRNQIKEDARKKVTNIDDYDIVITNIVCFNMEYTPTKDRADLRSEIIFGIDEFSENWRVAYVHSGEKLTFTSNKLSDFPSNIRVKLATYSGASFQWKVNFDDVYIKVQYELRGK